MVSKTKQSAGFTLIEMIVSIVILGILVGSVAVFIREPINAYFDTANRAALTGSADSAIRRMTRDIQSALPNSFRAPANGDNQCFEFLPVVAGGRYRVERDSTNDVNDDTLNFAAADLTFDVLAGHNIGPQLVGSWVTIYNLGIAAVAGPPPPSPGANAYNTPANNRAQIAGVGAAAGGATPRITLANAFQFPFESPGRRFQVTPNNSVIYACAGNAIWRSTRALAAATNPVAACPGAAGDLLVDNVDCAQTSFIYVPANATRDGQVEIMLTLTSAAAQDEVIRLYDRVSVNNVP
jgi:MSHA biogenesis protein MshO